MHIEQSFHIYVINHFLMLSLLFQVGLRTMHVLMAGYDSFYELLHVRVCPHDLSGFCGACHKAQSPVLSLCSAWLSLPFWWIIACGSELSIWMLLLFSAFFVTSFACQSL